MVKPETGESDPNDPEGVDITVVVFLLSSPAASFLPAVAPSAAAAGVYSRMGVDLRPHDTRSSMD